MAILFLDFDGVLHPTPSEALFIHNGLLHRWLRAAPEVDVVFSTSWRSSFDFETLVECVAFEAPDLASRFVGAIPEVDRGALDRRGDECRLWLEAEGRDGEPWCALDDQPAWFLDSDPVVAVDPAVGLTARDLEQAFELLSLRPASCRPAPFR